MITQEYLKKLFNYDDKTGLLTRSSRRCGVNINTPVGTIMKGHGYLRTRIDNKGYLVHRLIWLYVYGAFPYGQIDHINGIRLDNRISNLRDVSKKENLINKRIYSNSNTGITGVHWHKQHRKWAAVICKNGRRKHLGLFNNIEDAKKCRDEANKKYGFHFNHGNEVRICQM